MTATISDIPVASDTVPTIPATLEPVSSTSLTTTLLESAVSSVSSVSYPSMSHVHSSGPPPLIPTNMSQYKPLSTSTDSSLLLPLLSTLNLGASSSPTFATVPAVTSRISPDLMGVRTTTTTVDHHNHSQQFAASRLPNLALPTFSSNPLAWLTFWDLFQALIPILVGCRSLTI